MKTKNLIFCICVSLLVGCSVASANTYVNQTTHKITWDGIEWQAKVGEGLGPLNNNWSDAPSNIWVDNNNYLHLTIKYDGGKWNCTQLASTSTYTYKELRWGVASPVFTFDKNSVLGLFTYADDNHELDTETSKYAIGSGKLLRYTVQPYTVPGNTNVYLPYQVVDNKTVTMAGYDGHDSIYVIDWKQTYVNFFMYDNTSRNIASMPYTNTAYIPTIPQKVIMNFYLRAPPSNGQDLEVVIKLVRVT